MFLSSIIRPQADAMAAIMKSSIIASNIFRLLSRMAFLIFLLYTFERSNEMSMLTEMEKAMPRTVNKDCRMALLPFSPQLANAMADMVAKNSLIKSFISTRLRIFPSLVLVAPHQCDCLMWFQH